VKGAPTQPDRVVDKVLDATSGVGVEARVLDVRVGAFWVGVRTDLGTGLASALRSEDHLHGSRPIAAAGELHRWTPLELVGLLRSRSVPEASIGLAAVNALLQPAAARLPEGPAACILEDRCHGARLAMIGRFPFAEGLRPHCSRLDIFERGVGRSAGDLGEEDLGACLPEADVVAITATTLINGTLSKVLKHVREDAFLMMLGPSTPLSPVLVDFGFDVLCGTTVDDVDAVMCALGQGAVTSQIPGVRRVALWREATDDASSQQGVGVEAR
jgi:uncharacterized protein (DUF4213/DUF364 family)